MSVSERQFLLSLARQALAAAVSALPVAEPPDPCLTPTLREEGCCFVTLMFAGKLRGCIGNVQANKPLYRAVMENARGAGLRDWRFAPVSISELNQVHIEISVLSPARLLRADAPEGLLEQIHVGEHGVLLRVGFNTATFLPQVWRTFPEKAAFLSELSRKAGCAPDAWRAPSAQLAVYLVESFAED